MSTPHLPFRDLALVLVICVVWAGNFIAGANGMQHFSPFLFMILRFLAVLVLTLPFIRIPPAGQRVRLAVVCLSMGGLHFALMFWALSRSDEVSPVAIVQQTYIPMAVLLAMFLMKEQVGWRTLAAIGLSFAGVVVVGLDPQMLEQPDVLLIALFSAFFQAIGSIYQRGITGMGVMNFQGWTALISLPVFLTVSLLFEQGQWATIQAAGSTHWASVLYSAVLASLVGHGLFFVLVQRHPVSTVMPYLQLTPVIAVLFGILFWGDRPGFEIWIGGAMVIGGILFITLRAKRKATKMRH